MHTKHDILERHLLECLSFYEPMRLDHIFLDLDQSFLEENSELTMEDLKAVLKSLEKTKRIKKIKGGNDEMWIRIYPKKSLIRKIRSLLKL